jgi:LysR family hydrogen peroxide-inducible transcriptional activator
MMNLTLKQLRYFDAVARQRHFGRAADLCAISQPALSMQIRELEAVLGSRLFERGPRDVRLTDFGEAMLQRAREILRAVDELEGLARASRDQMVGRLRIGVIPTVAPYLLPRVVADLTRANPDIDLQIREAVTPTLLQEVRDGRLDTAIVALPVSEPSLLETALFSEAFVLVRPLAEADRPVPTGDSLREMRLLLLEEGHCFRDQTLSFCNAHANRPRQWMEGSSLSTLVQMVGEGIGVTLVPEMAVAMETRSASVSVSRLSGPEAQRTVGLVWRRSSPLARQLSLVADIVRRSAETLGHAPRPRLAAPSQVWADPASNVRDGAITPAPDPLDRP